MIFTTHSFKCQEIGHLEIIIKKIQLNQKFQGLIDEAAMRRKFAGTDAYLEEWSKGPKTEAEGNAESVAQSVASEIEERFTEIRDKALEVTK